MIQASKKVIKGALGLVQRALHPWHRSRARRSLEHAGRQPRGILILCHGNVCRSPYALVSLKRMVPEIHIDSAGFIGPGRPANEVARLIALERGLDLSSHVSKVVTTTMAAHHDLIVVMDPRQAVQLHRQFGRRAGVLVLGDLDPESCDRRTIPDPWGKETGVFRSSFDRIDRCLGELLSLLGSVPGSGTGATHPTAKT